MEINQSFFERDLLLGKAKVLRKCKSDINKANVMLEDIIRNTGRSEFSTADIRFIIISIAVRLNHLSYNL